ncbi:MAG: DUF1573 domain-containing protein [Muribaculaceae bacterium]|nr:DUF1573 domain-containing protein [Muribaculaceae bacterium]
MKRFSLSFILCLSVFSIFAGPHIKWDKTVHDFGAFDENNGRVTCRMTFVNDGNKPLVITAARATCGCTTPFYTKDQILPGQSGYVTISFNPIGRPGRFEKNITIETNGNPSKSTLTVKGVVIGSSNTMRSKFPVAAGPLRLRTTVIPFGEVEKGRTATAYFDVYNSSRETVSVGWENLPNYISVSGNRVVAPGEYASFAFTFASDFTSLYGIVDGNITLIPDMLSPGNRTNISTVAVVTENFDKMTVAQRQKAPVIGIIPENIDLKTVNHYSAPILESVTVKNFGINPLKIRRVYTSDPGITVKINKTEIKKGKTAQIEVAINPMAYSGKTSINAKIIVISNDPENPTASFRILAELRN